MESRKFADFKSILPGVDFGCVLDVGANVGETVAQTLQQFPRSIVHAFEPVQASFHRLSHRFAGNAQVHCHNFAVGDTAGMAQITAIGTDTGNQIVAAMPQGIPVENVEVRTGDEFVRTAGIEHVAFLKIDTEGFDLKVLQGFSTTLASQKIDIFQVEAGMGPQNTKHVPLQRFQELAAANDYWLFRLYEQAFELDGRPVLRRADAVFISGRCAQTNFPFVRVPKSTRRPARIKQWISALRTK